MAEEHNDADKTEDPTQKRRDEALARGDVVKSQEVNTWFVLAGGLLALYTFAGFSAHGLAVMLRPLLGGAHLVAFDRGGLMALFERLGLGALAVLALPFLLVALAGLLGNMVQHRPVWSGEGLKPKLARISPAAGLERLFSKLALVNFAKGLFKIALVGALMAWLLWPDRRRLDGMVATDPAALLPLTEGLALKLLATTTAVLAVVAILDYLYQHHVWFTRQKMSLRELKEEFRQTDGDPAIKSRMRQLRQSRMRRRMIAAVPKASVVITNPTHYAVALQYERGMNAPVCVAKGVDSLALKIREVATAHGIPIVENPPLARTLHATVEPDEEIPPEHYKAVAEVIGYIMRLRQAVRQ
ncbi:MAG TPA: flagellar biosynthesis protein FlhB [Xanthobacteraceae bacterium]|nr:flagellar biosynthesis protein FlhB [Xanthobacteraceae bacterium]